MSKTSMVTVLALLATAAADPIVFSAPLVASPYASSAYNYINPAQVVAAPVAPAVNVPAAVPAAYPAPYATVSAYSYGSSYSFQDYFPTAVNPSPALAYSLPYAYAADYYYRR